MCCLFLFELVCARSVCVSLYSVHLSNIMSTIIRLSLSRRTEYINASYSGYPGVYARVSDAYDWIQQEVCNSDSGENGGGTIMAPDSFGCTIKAEPESEGLAETPSVSPSVTPSETRITARPSASSTESDTTLSRPPTLAQEDGGSGFRTLFPTASSTATLTYPPTAESTIVSTEDITSAPIPATPGGESTTINTPTSTPAPTITQTEEGTILIFSELTPIPTISQDFTLFPTLGTGNEDNRLYSTTKKPAGFVIGTLFPTKSEEV